MIPFTSEKLKDDALHEHLVEFVGGRVLRGSQLVRESLWVERGKIINPQKVSYNILKLARSSLIVVNDRL